ncbi:MAG: hypothetical protein ABI574_00100 [Burkholderiales bacterium]
MSSPSVTPGLEESVAADGAAMADVAFRPVDLWALLEPEGSVAAGRAGGALSQVGPARGRLQRARLVRDPLDLATHVARVLQECHAALEGGDAAAQEGALFDALLDVFLALGPSGPELRAGLLARARPWLAPDHHAYLARHLGSGLGPYTALPAASQAVLGRGLIGAIALVRPPQAPVRSVSASQLLEQAIDLVDRGDAEAAQLLLEQALLADPHDGEVADELHQMYRLNGDDAALAAMTQRLRAQGLPVPAAWPAA